jgi:hypothetical protein
MAFAFCFEARDFQVFNIGIKLRYPFVGFCCSTVGRIKIRRAHVARGAGCS